VAKTNTPARQQAPGPPAQAPTPARPQPMTKELSGFLEGQSERIAKALPRHLTPERLIQVVTQIVHRSENLQKCHPSSILAAVIQASTLGLDLAPALGEAYLIPRKNKDTNAYEAHFQPGYRGLAKLARNSGGVAYVKAMLVHERDAFSYRYTPDLEFCHVPHLGAGRGDVTHAYAVAKLVTGEHLIEVMDADELEVIHRRSEGYKNSLKYNDQEKGPWVTDRHEMEKKTVLKRLAKSLPMSPELAEAVEADNQDYSDDPPPGRVGARLPARRGVAGLRQQLELDEPAMPPQGTKTYSEADDVPPDPGDAADGPGGEEYGGEGAGDDAREG
jgi:recombination protein RecT